jgi:hypothetical protein
MALSDLTSRTPARVGTPLVERLWIVAIPTFPVEPMTRTGRVEVEAMIIECEMVGDSVGGVGGGVVTGLEGG